MIGLFCQYLNNIYNREIPFLFVAVPYGTDFLFFEDFYCILLLIVTNIPVRNELSYNYRLSF